jgi:nucleotide-binding universal stress UspA family protein
METLPILLCTNGCNTSEPALEYGLWLAGALEAPVKLLGIIESEGQRACVEEVVETTARRLQESGLEYTTALEAGRGSVVIAREAEAGRYLTIFGPLGRPTWRRVIQGRSFRRVLARVRQPLLYVPRARLQLKRLLICQGGLGYASRAEQVGLYLARRLGAAVTLLHVVEPVSLQYPIAQEVQAHWRDVEETDTPQGRRLRESLAEVQAAGLQGEIRVRHGSVVHEILDEIQSGSYDLVAMGSPYSAQSLRRVYLPNVTAEVAEAAGCPVLTARA